MKIYTALSFMALALAALVSGYAGGAHLDPGQQAPILIAVSLPQTKSRVLVTTDIQANEPDDTQSLVRLLLYANEYDLEGIIPGTSIWNKNKVQAWRVDPIIDAYESSYANLAVHADGYPTAAYLRSITHSGIGGYGIAAVGDANDTPGTRHIESVLTDPDPRPIYVGLWGGGNSLAQALWDLRKKKTSAELNAIIAKIRVFDISGQDDAGAWMAKNFPSMIYLRQQRQYKGVSPHFSRATDNVGDLTYTTQSWISSHIQSHGPLGAEYPLHKFIMEGDSPHFLYLIRNGLSDPEQWWHGSWGGRFTRSQSKNLRGNTSSGNQHLLDEARFDDYSMYEDASDVWTFEGTTYTGDDAKKAAVARWRPAFQNDMAARMDWSINPSYSGANHNPIAICNGLSGTDYVMITAAPGETVQLSAAGSSDPDSDRLSYHWWHYLEAGNYPNALTITDSGSPVASTVIPDDAQGSEIHLILEVQDNGSPSLTSYRRVIINVGDGRLALAGTASQSSTDFGGLASRAIDGNISGVYARNSVTHTANEAQPWWQLDLGGHFQIDDIEIWGRTDDASKARLSNYDVVILDRARQQVWSNYQANYPAPMVSLDAGGVVGRYIRVQLRGTNSLSLAEVKVFGKNEVSGLDEVSALSGPATVSAGSTVDVSFDYQASAERDLLLRLEQNNADTSLVTAANKRIRVQAGSQSVTQSITIDKNAPAGVDYRWQLFLTKPGGNFNEKLDVVYQRNVALVAAADTNNLPPLFNSATFSTADAIVGLAYSASIAGQASDPDDDPLSFSLISGPDWLSLGNDGMLSGTPSVASSQDSFQVKVADGRGGEATASLRIMVASAPAANNNIPPVFNSATFSTADATVGLAYRASIAGEASDADGDPLSFSLVSGPAWLSLSNDGALRGTPSVASSEDSFQVRVVDGRGGEATATLAIEVIDTDAGSDPGSGGGSSGGGSSDDGSSGGSTGLALLIGLFLLFIARQGLASQQTLRILHKI